MHVTSLVRRTLLTSCVSAVLIVLLMIAGGRTTTSQGEQARGRTAAASSPRGILFLRGQGLGSSLWLADADGRNAQELLTGVIEYDVSPDGAAVVYTRQAKEENVLSGGMQRLALDSGITNTLVADDEALTIAPVWSPAGGIVAYEQRRRTETGAGAPKVWLVAEDGASLGGMVPGSESVTYGPVWSTDGTRIAASEPTGEGIVIFNFTKNLRRLPISGNAGLDWSPSGKHLIISVEEETAQGPLQHLVLYDLTTDEQRQIALGGQSSSAATPRWSPDGKHIAFVHRSDLQPNGEIWMLDVDDAGAVSNIRPVTQDPRYDNSDPHWSPHGRRLIWSRFALDASGAQPSLWGIDLVDAVTPTLLIEDAQHGRWRP